MTASRAGLRSLVEPESVAVVGASDDPTRIGGRVLSYLAKGGYRGRVVPVNPNRATVQGLTAFASVAEAPAAEAAVLAVPAAVTVDTLAQCAARGTRAAVVFSSGFAEAGDEGAAMQRAMSDLARRTGMRVLGPNCLGLFTPHVGYYAAFSNTLDRTTPAPGGLSIVSQSGAFGSHLYYLAHERGLGIRYWISTGNECDVDVAEALGFVARDDGTRTILLYLEGARDGPALVAALEAARAAGKPVIVVKAGRSAVGAEAAASHTASLAGGDAVYRAVFRDGGAWQAASGEEAVDVALLCERCALPAGRGLGILTVSGGGGILAADAAAEAGLEMPAMPEAAQAEIRALLPYAAPRNPVDVTAQAFNRMDLFRRNLDIVLGQGGYDAVLVYFTTVAGSPAIAPGLIEALTAVRQAHPQVPAVLSLLVEPELERAYAATGYPVIADAGRAVRALAALCGFAEAFRRPARPSPEPATPVSLPEDGGERAALAFLGGNGVPVVAARYCRSVAASVAAFRELGGPVAMKLASPDILHKTEVGGVRLDLADEAQVSEAFEGIVASATRHRPAARIEGVVVAPMLRGGVEVIVGVHRDPVFGPMIMFGMGGIFAEILEDVTFALPPLDRESARAMIARVRGYPLLTGARGRPPCDVDALADLLAAVSRIAVAAGDRLASLDINPVAVFAEGEGCVALDAALELRQPDKFVSRGGMP